MQLRAARPAPSCSGLPVAAAGSGWHACHAAPCTLPCPRLLRRMSCPPGGPFLTQRRLLRRPPCCCTAANPTRVEAATTAELAAGPAGSDSSFGSGSSSLSDVDSDGGGSLSSMNDDSISASSTSTSSSSASTSSNGSSSSSSSLNIGSLPGHPSPSSSAAHPSPHQHAPPPPLSCALPLSVPPPGSLAASLPATASVDLYESVDMDLATPYAGSVQSAFPPGTAPRPTSNPESLTDVESPSDFRPFNWFTNQRDLLTLSYAVLVGGVVAASVYTFDVTIQYIHDIPDSLANMGIGGGRTTGFPLPYGVFVPFRCIMPVGAGFAVAWLATLGFAPPLKVVCRAVDSVQDDVKNASLPKDYGQVFRKAAASAITLGSGASLGPEAPSVELGANTAAVLTPKTLSRRRQRMLLAAGAAAGVSAAFDAPVAGALFAVEFVLKSSRLGLDRLSTSTVFVSTSVAAAVVGFLRAKGQALGIMGSASHLVGRIPYFSIQPNLLYDVAQFSLLGVGCASAAVALYEGVRMSEILLKPMPRWVSAPLAGGLCGVIALKFPQVQYGYVNLEEVFRDSTRMEVGGLLGLLTAKIAATSVCVGGGLVGGLFAPSLFLGALVGDIVGHYFTAGVADGNTFVVVGAAAVLGAACRAPLTAITLMVEITRDTGLLVPLLAAIGTASLVTDYLEGAFSRWLEAKLVEMYLEEKSMFWGAGLISETNKRSGPVDAVESAMSVTTDLYVRHSLPLVQAREAMAASKVKAAVVVDDNFSPVGIAYLDDVEEEIVRQRLLNERDSNFGSGNQ